jgi:hypothetical protein
MPKKLIDTGGRPLLDLTSYARRGPGRRDHLSPAEVELIQRTVSRTPEVMIKVLSRGANTLKAVRAHFAYLNRGGELEIETDEGERLAGKEVSKRLLEDWDLDVEQHRRRADLRPGQDRAPPRLVHKILFSMPPGTPPRKVLEAVKNFARDEFALQHRYAMVLHTDEPHPHVHLVVKAMSEQGIRLNIRKDTLRRWRAEFATHLRGLGVAANATERAVRGENRPPLRDPIYRAGRRGDSRVLNGRSARDADDPQVRAGRETLRNTRELVRRGWHDVEELLRESGRADLATQVATFQMRMSAPLPARELSIDELVQRRAARTAELHPTR